MIRHCLSRQGLPAPPARRLDSLLDQLEARRDAEVRVAWSGGEARIWRKTLYLMAPPVSLPPDWRGEWDGRSPLVTPLGEFRMGLVREDGSPARLTLAPRLGGEDLRLPGRGTRDLKRVLQERGVPPWERARAWVVWQGECVVAVGGPRGGWRSPRDGERLSSDQRQFQAGGMLVGDFLLEIGQQQVEIVTLVAVQVSASPEARSSGWAGGCSGREWLSSTARRNRRARRPWGTCSDEAGPAIPWSGTCVGGRGRERRAAAVRDART